MSATESCKNMPISFATSVCLTFASDSRTAERIFMKYGLLKFINTFQFRLKLDNNNAHKK